MSNLYNSTEKKKNFTITEYKTIREALIKINKNLHKCLIVVDKNNKLKGTITDGNIRRAFLAGKTLENNIKKVYSKKNVIFIKEKNYSLNEAKKKLTKNYHQTYIGIIPIINKEKKIVDFFTKDSIKDSINPVKQINPVVIMAGGKGLRLKPFTEVLPKPLIPIGNKTAIDHIIDNFKDNGFNKFIFSINYKSKLIKAYIQELKNKKRINSYFVNEKKPLGTAGSLSLLKNKLRDDFFVINCDSLINLDFSTTLKYHKAQKNDITIVVSMKDIIVPYGVFEIKKGGSFHKMIEKPSNRYLVNTGLYILSPKILSLIPKNKKCDFNDLIHKIKKTKLKIGFFPIEDKNWSDVGQWSNVKKILAENYEI